MSTTIASAPAPASNTNAPPSTDGQASGVADDLSSIDNIIAGAVSQTLAENPEQTETEEAPQRDEKGRFLPKAEKAETPVEGEQVAAPVVEGEPVAEPEPEPIALPEGMAAVKKIEGRELVAQFKVLDTDGELEVPDITLEFEANGKTRREPIDKVVKLAQMGVYNHEREQRLVQTQQEVQQIKEQYTQVEARARALEQERERFLSDPDYLVQALTQYEQQNTPEARLTRDREQLEQQRAELEFQRINEQGEAFFTRELVPAIETITQALSTVGAEEIGARLVLVQERYKVHTPMGSYIPPSAYPQVKQALIADILPWAQQLHESRDSERKLAIDAAKQEAEAAKAKAKEAQVTAQKKTNLIGRTVKPGSRAPQGTTTNTATPKSLVTVQDYEEDAIRSAVQGALQATG